MGPMVQDLAQTATVRPLSGSEYAYRFMEVGFGMLGPPDTCFLMLSGRSDGRAAGVLHETDHKRQ